MWDAQWQMAVFLHLFSFVCSGAIATVTVATIQSTNVVGGTLYISTRHRQLNSFISNLLRKVLTQSMTPTLEKSI